jgi:protein ImuB
MWLALHLPALPLQLFERASARALPLAVGEGERVLACNAAARAQGVRPGMTEAAARASAVDLRLLPRRPAAERAALERLGTWALGFSDHVSLDPAAHPQALVLEAGRSLKLFGGAAALHRQVAAGAADLGWHARCVLAPTPGGALLLAAAGHSGPIPDLTALRRALAALPTALAATTLTQDPRLLEDLTAMGIKCLGDLLRLPRAGLAERIGSRPLQQLERLLGERPDPHRPFIPPAYFEAELELPAEVAETGALLFGCRRLLDELGAFLLARQGGVQQLDWQLAHAELPTTLFRLGTTRLERRPAHWLTLLRERLQRLTLPAPVQAIGLVSEPIQPLPPASGHLALGADDGPEPDPTLLERLRARLGDAALYRLAPHPDHRPERAWRRHPLDVAVPDAPGTQTRRSARAPPAATASALAPGAAVARPDRPLWLLPTPRPLPLHDRRPWLDGPLHLGPSCERIETGWWDGDPVARDYYVATTMRGERLWVYREMHAPRRWFLHGIFGPR